MRNGIDLKGVMAYMRKLETAGRSVGDIADAALTAAGEPSKKAFAGQLPYDSAEKDPYHAQDHVNISPIDGEKVGKKYRVIGVFTGDKKRDWSAAQYLFYVENGTSKMDAQPFLKDAWEAVDEAAIPIMTDTALAEIKKRFG